MRFWDNALLSHMVQKRIVPEAHWHRSAWHRSAWHRSGLAQNQHFTYYWR